MERWVDSQLTAIRTPTYYSALTGDNRPYGNFAGFRRFFRQFKGHSHKLKVFSFINDLPQGWTSGDRILTRGAF